MNKFFSAILILIIIGVLSIASFFGYAILSPSPILNKEFKQAAVTRIYNGNNKLVRTTDSVEDRIPVSLSKIPLNLQHAFLAAEDIRFYDHFGLDFKGIARAFITNISGGYMQGASTITQQLAKNAFLTQERTLSRKVQEALISLQLEMKYTKSEILEMYLNQIYFGRGAYGVESASLTYFGKSADRLNLAECAMLAGIPKSPNYYSPLNNPKIALNRQHIVLKQMEKYGFITASEEKETEKVQLIYKSKLNIKGSSDYFYDYCLQTAIDMFGADAVYKDGLKIYTTLDPAKQKNAEEAIKLVPVARKTSKGLEEPQMALISIDPKTGYIKAMIGGRNTDKFNRATLAIRQPGSAFKPFVYLTALEKGASPATIIEDKAIDFVKDWHPQNYEKTFFGKVSMRTALVHSINIPAIIMAHKVGPINVRNYAEKLGITTLVHEGRYSDSNLAMAIGGLTHGVTPIDMAGAYGVLANQGMKNTPTAIRKILDRNGKLIYKYKSENKKVATPKSVYLLVNMLEDVMKRGTGGRARINRPCAGKTGTTDNYTDAWFVGFTPELSTAVWVGNDDNKSLGYMTGGTYPAMVWKKYMASSLKNEPIKTFVKPNGLIVPPDPVIIQDEVTENDEKSLDTGKIPKIIKRKKTLQNQQLNEKKSITITPNTSTKKRRVGAFRDDRL